MEGTTQKLLQCTFTPKIRKIDKGILKKTKEAELIDNYLKMKGPKNNFMENEVT